MYLYEHRTGRNLLADGVQSSTIIDLMSYDRSYNCLYIVASSKGATSVLLCRLCCFPSSEHTKRVEVVSSESLHFLITILVTVQLVLLGDSHLPQNGSLKN